MRELHVSGLAHMPAAREPARWYVRDTGQLVEVVRLTRPHRSRSLVLVARAGIDRSPTWYAEARDLIRN